MLNAVTKKTVAPYALCIYYICNMHLCIPTYVWCWTMQFTRRLVPAVRSPLRPIEPETKCPCMHNVADCWGVGTRPYFFPAQGKNPGHERYSVLTRACFALPRLLLIFGALKPICCSDSPLLLISGPLTIHILWPCGTI